MKCSGKTVLCLTGVLVLTPVVRAVINDSTPAPATAPAPQAESTSEQPYSAIWVRNVFDLKPKEAAVVAASTNPPPANVHLIGITTLFGTRALISIQPANTPGQPPQKEQTYTMSEGQRQGLIELLEIDPKNRKVKIKNEELVSTITFETNRPSAPQGGGAPPAMAGGRPPGFQPAGFAPPVPGGGTPLPARTVRPSGDFSQNSFQPSGTQPTYAPGYQPTFAATGASAPAAGLNLGNLFNQPQSVQQNTPVPEVPLEVSAAQMILQKRQLESQGVQAPPLPPIFDTPEINGSGAGNVPTTPSPTPTRNFHGRVTGNYNLPLPPAVPGQ